MLRCPACGQENPEGFKFCGACGSSLAPAEPAPEEERKVVTALFTDIVGSTARAETMDPEDVRAMLAPYYTRLRSELESFGGTVEKFIGDAVVALFGAPVAHEDDPERAVRAALAITDAVADLNAEHDWLNLHIRTAVNTGEALVVVGARAAEGEGMAAGDVMNTAARLQGAAPVDGVAVGEATFRATADLFEYEAAEPVAAKGKAQPVLVWIVVGEKTGGRPTPWRPLIGRSEEVERLSGIWRRASAESRPQLVNVIGAPGIGKSRLLVELCQRIDPDARTYWGRCLPYGEGITYWPVAEIIRNAAEVRHDDDTGTLSRKLGALLESLATEHRGELRTMAAAAANLLGAATTPEGTYQAEEIGQAELHWGIRRIVELLALQSPLLLVFEDLHWAEPTLLELLLSMLEGAGPLAIVGTARPELVDENAAFTSEDENRHLVVLEPLGKEESEQLLGELVGTTGVDVARLRLLLDNAGGNPLFLEETVRMLADADLLEAGAAIESLPIPESLQALIGSRLDSLTPADKRVAQQASVVGAIFWLGAVVHLAGSNADLGAPLTTLERRDFVYARPESTVAGDREFAFKHILIRDVAYERLPKGRRAELHVLFSEWLSGLPGAGDEFVEIYAYHLEQACRLAREVVRSPIEAPVVEAASALKRAAEKAERREGAREARRFYERALELVGDEHLALAAELRLGRGRTLARLGVRDSALAEFGLVAEQAVAAGRLNLRGEALVALSNIELARGNAEAVRGHLEEATAIAAELDDRRLGIRTAYVFSALRGDFDGDLESAIELLRDALAIAEELGDLALRVEGHLRSGFLLFNKGELERAQDELLRCTSLAEDLGSVRDQARATFMLGLVEYYRGDLDEAERLALQTAEWLTRAGDGYFQVQNLVWALAVYALGRGDLTLAEERLGEALPLALELVGGGGWIASQTYRYLAQTYARQGRIEEAAELVEFAGRDVPDENVYARAQLGLAEGFVFGAQRNNESARARFEEALELLERQGFEIELAEARITYGHVLRDLGDEATSRYQFELARASLASMGATRLVEEIDGTLAKTAVGPA